MSEAQNTAATAAEAAVIRLADYQVPPFLVDHVALNVLLDDKNTIVEATLSLRRNPDAAPGSDPSRGLRLDGRCLELLEVDIDGVAVPEADWLLDDESLTLNGVPDSFSLRTRVRVHPDSNTSLEGLYLSSGNFCTQCEAQGFRKITFFPDRPDVMTPFSVRIEADRERYPVLLSNGNPVSQATLENGRHEACWDDPFPKPSYLFALVAGQLRAFERDFTTMSGRAVALKVWVEPRNAGKCEHAMDSLVRSMRWDEEQYGREYDLDVFNIVAVDDFNMGAMENKGLNVFNSKYVLAEPSTATDDDYVNIEGVVAHEYFHNWTGNRVTCRDWFQLSLKEGLTVFRDQEFSADMAARASKRIGDVQSLRAHQFMEDAGPMAHPVRPESYIEINNFYTSTVYNKGAEVVRMIHTLLGAEGFRKGCDLYFERHDGCAVTTEDFVAAMEDANGADLKQFRLWYSQAGTPKLTVRRNWDAAAGALTLDIDQSLAATPGQPEKQPMPIPFSLGLMSREGQALTPCLEGEEPSASASTRVLELKAPTQSFRFVGLPSEPVPSLLRGFSAPVTLDTDLDEEELALLAAFDGDDFGRWEAGQQLSLKVLLGMVEARREGRRPEVPGYFLEAMRRTLVATDLDRSLVAKALLLPSEDYIGEQMPVIDVEGVTEVRNGMRRKLGADFNDVFAQVYTDLAGSRSYEPSPDEIGRRALRNVCLGYLGAADGSQVRGMAFQQFSTADNMTDRLAALHVLTDLDCDERETALADFYRDWHHEPLVLDKWFTAQALSRRASVVEEVEALLGHKDFNIKNPNRVRSLVAAFAAANPAGFHRQDGRGYALVADLVIRLDAINPQTAARIVGTFSRWRRYDSARGELMTAQLRRILAVGPSKDVYEIASKSLGDAKQEKSK